MKQKIETCAEQILLNDYDKYYRLAYSYVKNEHDALDIVQETAYKVIKDCGKVKEPEYLSTWIYRIVINTAIDFLRKQQKESLGLDGVEIPWEDKYHEGDSMELLNSLDEKERIVVTLKYFEELKLDEIAKVLGENVNTVKARLYRALKKLEVKLGPDMA